MHLTDKAARIIVVQLQMKLTRAQQLATQYRNASVKWQGRADSFKEAIEIITPRGRRDKE